MENTEVMQSTESDVIERDYEIGGDESIDVSDSDSDLIDELLADELGLFN